jgi:flagellar biosynthetic protein FliP
MPQLTLSLADVQGPEQVVPALKILLMFTILSIAPAILISMTSFTRIVIVLSFLRQALGSQNVPPMQVIMALSLLLTGVVMTPVAQRLDVEAFEPYQQKELNEKQAFERAATVARDFLVPQTREADLRLFYELNRTPLPKTQAEVGLHLLVPAFMISELRTAFEMGFLIFLPFVLIDLIVASILTAMGMVMLPPTMLATPLKLLLFVVVDGWSLLSRSLVASFG